MRNSDLKIKSFTSGINLALSRYLGKEYFISFQIFTNWKKLVPARIADKTKPIYFDSGKLLVLGSTFQWVNELTLNRLGLIEQINKNFGEDIITDIEFKQGNIKSFTYESILPEKKQVIKLTKPEERLIEEEIQKYDLKFQATARKMLKFYYVQRKKQE